MKIDTQTITFESITQLLTDRTFIIEDYQRGYKWDKEQVTALLNDLQEHYQEYASSLSPYCLQPLVVCHRGNNNYEVIDGQQRLTSLYLLLSILVNFQKVFFDIKYQVRDSSQEFLKSLDKQSLSLINKSNSDIYHFTLAGCTINEWLETKNINSNSFLNHILQNVNFIWYQITESADPNETNKIIHQTFVNLNRGKIPLTGSELIKALFILKIKSQSIRNDLILHEINKLSFEWDHIEKQLNNEDLWGFLINKKDKYTAGTRIDFLFDLIHATQDKDAYAAYREYDNNKERLNWHTVKQCFHTIIDWYNDKEIYHYLGYLITSGIKPQRYLTELYQSYKDSSSKSEFIKSLKTDIIHEFNRKRNSDFIYLRESLSFDESKQEVERLLLLSNIMYYLNGIHYGKFPFALYRRNTWSVEHIIPQTLNSEAELIEFIKEYNVTPPNDPKQINSTINEELKIHDIDNLVLLELGNNSQFSNKALKEKQQLLISLDTQGVTHNDKEVVFIPIATKNVFLKMHSYNNPSNITCNIWSKTNRNDYWNFLTEQLKEFLPTNGDSHV